MPSEWRHMPQCNQCGAFVTARFARVFGDNQDTLHGCRSCMSVGDLVEGGAVPNQ